MAPIKAPRAPKIANSIGLEKRVKATLRSRRLAAGRPLEYWSTTGDEKTGGSAGPGGGPLRMPDGGGAAGIASGCPHFGQPTVCPAALSGTFKCVAHFGQAKTGMSYPFSALSVAVLPNPKPEYRNPKQIPNAKNWNPQTNAPS